MDRRSNTLKLTLAVVFAGSLLATFVYPRWVKPLVTIKDAIVRLEEQRDALAEDQRRVDQEVRVFRGFVNRVGALDIRRVENEIRARLNEMLAEHKLERTSVTPNTPRTAKKTGTQEMTVTVKAEGTLESAIKLMRDLAELPHLVRVLNTTIQPVSGGRRKTRGKKKEERVSLTVPLLIMALPQQKLAGRIEKDDIEQPEVFVRHENRDYSAIWTRTPFTPYIVYPPLKVKLKEANMRVQETKRCNLEAVATGGDGDYEFVWSPSGGIDKPTVRRVRVDTKSTGKRSYTVTVTDGQGEIAKATANVEIVAKAKPRAVADSHPPPPPPPVPTGPQRWKNGRDMQLCMALLNRSGLARHSEIMVHNKKSGETTYYTIGDDFDAGTLVFVHPTGALVRREVDKKDKYFVYPIGAALTEDLASETAADYPKLQASADWFVEQDEMRRAAAAAAAPGQDAPGASDAPGAKNSEKQGSPAGASPRPGSKPKQGKPTAATGQKPAKAADAGAKPPVSPSAGKKPANAARDQAQPSPAKGVNSTGAAGSKAAGANKPGASGKPAKKTSPVKGTPSPTDKAGEANGVRSRSNGTATPEATKAVKTRPQRASRSRRNRGVTPKRSRPTRPKARKKD